MSLILTARHRDDFGTLRDSDSPISFITCPSRSAPGLIPGLGPTLLPTQNTRRSMTQEEARWLEDHDCPETEELDVLTMPGSPESKIRTIKVCPECKPLLDTPDATPDDLDRFRLRDT